MTALSLDRVCLRRGSFALRDISFKVEEGKTAILLGGSGSGKSLLLAIISGGIWSESGVITYFDREMYQAEKEIRREISTVFDTPNFNTDLTAVRVAREISRFEPWFDLQLFTEQMNALGLDATARVKQYSNQMLKKYMVLLALCRKPRLLLLDDIFSGLDGDSGSKIADLIRQQQRDNSMTILLVAQEETEEMDFDQTYRLEKGGLA